MVCPRPQLSAAPANEQKPEEVYGSATVLKSVTRLVVVDVVATDKNGAITNLKRDDFTLLEDGKEQQIRAFHLQKSNRDQTATPLVTSKLPENVFTNKAHYNAGSALNVVLLDILNTNLLDQAKARDKMTQYLERMPSGRPVAVYTLGTRLTLLQDFTNDPVELKAAVRELKGKNSPLLDGAAGSPEPELLAPGVADSMMPPSVILALQRFEQERVSSQADARLNYTLASLKAIARLLSGYPGRKNLIWISGSFPLTIDPNMDFTTDSFAGDRSRKAEITETADALMNAQIAVYPIDAHGLSSSSIFTSENTGRDKLGRQQVRGDQVEGQLDAESNEIQGMHGSMQEPADRTGGKAFYNINNYDEAVFDSIEDGSTYYTLAYYPENKNWNGKFRKLQVKAGRAGVKLRYRLGYYAVDPKFFAAQNQKARELAFDLALRPGTPISTALPFHAQVLAPEEKAQPVVVNYAVDPSVISFEKQSDGLQHAALECAVQAFSAEGKRVAGKHTLTNAALKPAAFDQIMLGTFPCQQSIDLPPGNYFLRLGVRDNGTGLIGTLNAKVTIAGAEKKP